MQVCLLSGCFGASRAAMEIRLRCIVIVAIAIFANLTAVSAQTPITGVSAQATSFQVAPPDALLTDAGLTQTAPGVFQLVSNPFILGGTMWVSGSLPAAPDQIDQNPYVQFNLGATYTVNKFHIWNYNEANGYSISGFRDTTVQYSLNGTTWKTIAQRFRFARAPGDDTYTGEDYLLTYPVSARYIRFQADNTYQIEGGMYTGRAGLGKVRFYAGGTVTTPVPTGGIFPSDAGVVNVKFPPYNAKGDGVTDDTAALKQAIADWQGTLRTIYLPAGRYIVTDSLKLAVRDKDAHFGGGFTVIRGESSGSTVIRLANNTFTDAANPKPILSAANNSLPGGGISADWFNLNFSNLTIDSGFGNPGAIGVQFYSNNVGAIRDMVIKSEDGQGEAALDLAYADQNGPMYAKNITTQGFKVGVRMATAVNGITLENITIKNPTVVGVSNNGQCVALRNLTVTGAVTAVDTRGVLSLIGATLTGNGATVPAIINNESLYARNISKTGYSQLIQNNYGDTAGVTGTNTVSEYVSHAPLSLFPTRPRSLTLPIETTPDAVIDSPSAWANVRNYRLITDPDDTLAAQRAIDSGATTVYFPGQGTYYLSGKVYIRNNVRRIVGMFGDFRKVTVGAGFQVEAGTPNIVVIEDAGSIGASIDLVNNSSRTLVCRNLQDIQFYPQGTGDWYLENVATGQLTLSAQKIWARQLNIEKVNPKVTNNGGTLWILGMKAEDGGTLIKTTGGGKSELLGGIYYSQFGDVAPMFINQDSSLSASIGEVNYTVNPFQILVSEARAGVTRNLTKAQVPQRRYDPGSMLPLYVGYVDPAYLAPPYNLAAVGGDHKITLTWEASPGAISHTVRRSTSFTGPFTTLATVTTNSYVNTGLTPGATYYYTVSTTYAGGSSAPSSPAGSSANAVLRLNSGGGASGLFAGDAFSTGGTTYRNETAIDLSGAVNPAPAEVYKSERYGNFSYALPNLTPGATYKLRFHFAELYFTSPGQRVFNVAINGANVLTNFDIIATAGAPFKAIVREFTATADAAGKITIDLTGTVDNAKINGLEVIIP